MLLYDLSRESRLWSGNDVGRTNHAMNGHGSETTLPGAHHIIHEVSWLDRSKPLHLLILRHLSQPFDSAVFVFGIARKLIRSICTNGVGFSS